MPFWKLQFNMNYKTAIFVVCTHDCCVYGCIIYLFDMHNGNYGIIARLTKNEHSFSIPHHEQTQPVCAPRLNALPRPTAFEPVCAPRLTALPPCELGSTTDKLCPYRLPVIRYR